LRAVELRRDLEQFLPPTLTLLSNLINFLSRSKQKKSKVRQNMVDCTMIA
jgi:hypothetical protein